MAPHHFNTQFARTTQLWNGSDTEELYKKHCANPESLRKLQQLGWYECHDLTYVFNSEGFRDEEFDQRPAALAIGCSHTQGVGVKVQQCWPRQLENMLEKKVWNLGVSGISLDTCYRLLEYWIDKLNVDAVFCAAPPISRYEVFANYWYTFLPQSTFECFPKNFWLQNYHKLYLSQEEPWHLNRRKNIHAIKDICSQRGVRFYVDYLDTFVSKTVARDLMHTGPSAHTQLAADFFAKTLGDSVS